MRPPNHPVTISSWAFDAARSAGVRIHDNRAVDVLCYLPTYTFVEKLQTVSTKYRLHKTGEAFPANFMRHYYDIYCLLTLPEIQAFIGTPAYEERKVQRFRSGNELVAAKTRLFCWKTRKSTPGLPASIEKLLPCITTDSQTWVKFWPVSGNSSTRCSSLPFRGQNRRELRNAVLAVNGGGAGCAWLHFYLSSVWQSKRPASPARPTRQRV